MNRAPSPPQLYGDHPIFAQAELEWVKAEKGVLLRLAKWRGGSRGTVHIFNGRTEYIEKYSDVISRLVARGFSVTAHDWRGQGLSTRNALHPMRCHVMDFAEFQTDAQAIMRACADMPKPRKLICHSMGGAIGLRYLHGKHNIESAIFSAPMWGIHISWTLKPFAPFILNYVKRHEREWDCVFGTFEEPYENYEPFRKNLLTNDPAVYESMSETLKTFPELGLGGPTYYWLFAANKEIEELMALPAPNIPALVFVGSKEKIVDAKRLSPYARSAPSFRLIELKGGKHENYIEISPIRQQFWDQIDSFWLTD